MKRTILNGTILVVALASLSVTTGCSKGTPPIACGLGDHTGPVALSAPSLAGAEGGETRGIAALRIGPRIGGGSLKGTVIASFIPQPLADDLKESAEKKLWEWEKKEGKKPVLWDEKKPWDWTKKDGKKPVLWGDKDEKKPWDWIKKGGKKPEAVD